MRTFTDEKTGKFWDIDLQGDSFIVTSGDIGTRGRRRTRTFADPGEARREHDRLITEKLAEGFVETTPPAVPAAPRGRGVREALEEALAANPDDVAAHMAYADRLQEEGDPRGEFIQAQLALEDEGLPAAERRKLQRREKALLKAHERDWLGELAPFLLDNEGLGEYHRQVCRDFGFSRGWLDTLHLEYLPFGLARLLSRSPRARLLRDLWVEQDANRHEVKDPGDVVIPDNEYHAGLCALASGPPLANLRVFRLGRDDGEDYRYFRGYMHTRAVPALVRQMPGLEELYLWANGYDLDALFQLPTLENLRVLKVYHQNRPHRLDLLAKNPALKRLTHLLLHPHHTEAWSSREPIPRDEQEEGAYINLEGVQALLKPGRLPALTHLQLRLCSMGDEGCDEIVVSGILKRLVSLDLRHGRITDVGALALAECRSLRRLQYLDVERNGLTRVGVKRLQGLGIPTVRADDQLGEEYALGGLYLYEGDFE